MRHTFPMVNIAISSVWTVHTRRITLLGPIQTRISILTFFWEHKFKDIETSHEHQPSYRQQLNELWPLMLVVFSCLTLFRHAPAFANAPLSYSNAFDNFELFYMGDCVRHSRISPRSTRLRFFFFVCLRIFIRPDILFLQSGYRLDADALFVCARRITITITTTTNSTCPVFISMFVLRKFAITPL